MNSVLIFHLAESNIHVQLALAVLALTLACCPLIYNIEQLIVEFTSEAVHATVGAVSNVFYFIFVGAGAVAAIYLYFVLEGIQGSLRYSQ